MGLMAIGADQRADELAELTVKEIARAAWINLIVGALVIAVMFGVAILSSLTIGRPIRRIAEVLLQLAGGRNDVEIPYQGRQDEIGDAARAASIFRDNIVRMQELEAEQKRTVEEAARARREQTHRLADEFEQAVGAIVKAVSRATGELQGTAKSLTETADVTHQLANSVSVAATEASKNVRSVAVASDQLASSIAEIGQQAQQSREIANEAVRSAATTDARIAQMSQVADRIGHVLSLITEIARADQPAGAQRDDRSGAQRRGRARLCGGGLRGQDARQPDRQGDRGNRRSRSPTSRTVTRDSVDGDQGHRLDHPARVARSRRLITSAVEEQHAATREIAYNVQEAAQGTDNVTAKIKNLEADASETGAAASQVFSFASQLAAEGNTLKLQVEKFLGPCGRLKARPCAAISSRNQSEDKAEEIERVHMPICGVDATI